MPLDRNDLAPAHRGIDPRSRAAFRSKALALGFFSRGIAVLIRMPFFLLLTALVARHLSPEEFGLWVVLYSFVELFAVMDLGFGLTLRNRLAALHSDRSDRLKDHRAQDEFLSIFYAFLAFSSLIILIVCVLKPLIPWGAIFKTADPALAQQAGSAATFVLAVLILNLTFMLSQAGFFAYQETHWVSAFDLLKAISTFVAVWAAISLRGSFSSVVWAFYAVLLFTSVSCLATFLLRRSWKFAKVEWADLVRSLKSATPTSFKFALMQVAGAIIFYTHTYIVSYTAGMSAAGDYGLVQRLFLLLNGIHFFLLTPLWSAYTEAAALGDWQWVRKQMRWSLLYTAIVYGLGVGLFLAAGPKIILIWTGKSIHQPGLYMVLGAWAIVYGWINCFSVFLNALNCLDRQVQFLVGGAILNLPLAFFLGSKLGSPGVALAGLLVVLPLAVSDTIQSFKILGQPGQTARQAVTVME